MTPPTRVRISIVALGLAGLVLAGCNVPSNDPTSYQDQNDLTQRNFVAGCTGADPIVDGTTTTLAQANVCECQYAVFVAKVPYSDSDKGKPQYAGYAGKTFLEINAELKRDGTKLNDNSVVPQAVRDALNQCVSNPTSATLPPGFSTGTTGSAGGTGTTVGTAPGTSALQ